MSAQPEFDFGKAREERDKGIERVLANTPEWWKANYERLMSQHPDLGPSFIAEDFRLYATPIIGKPPHHNSWGGMWGKLAVPRGWVKATGAERQMKTRKSHARRSALYCWPAQPQSAEPQKTNNVNENNDLDNRIRITPLNDQELRLGLESASSAYRRRRCSGSVNLIRALRKAGKLPEPLSDPNAESGTLVHKAWASVAPRKPSESQAAGLSSMQQQTLASLYRMERLLVTDWAGQDEAMLLGRELRLWLHQNLEPVHSGQLDAAYFTKSARMLILDGKTLFGEVSPAETNDQLRELVALARHNYPAVQQFTVAILQPWVSGRPSVAVYDLAQADLALAMLRNAISEADDPDAPRTPGAWCKHCPAIAGCEEAKTLVIHTASLAQRIERGEYVLPAGGAGTSLLDFIASAEPIMKAIRERYRALLSEAPDAVPGWYLREGKKIREISEVRAAYQIATTRYMSIDAFFDAVSVKIGSLQEQFGLLSGLKGRSLEEDFNSTFADVISLKQNKPELVRESQRKGRHKELKDS